MSVDLSSANSAAALPPRKRARTQEEKEQRRIERILRNRRAAHASREKKRKHVEFLENHVAKLEESLNVYKQNQDKLQSVQYVLIDRLLKLGGDVSDIDTQLLPTIEVERVDKTHNVDDSEDEEDAEMEKMIVKKEPVSKAATNTLKAKPEDYYLSPPISNIDSTSPSNFVVKMEHEDDIYYKSPLPLFDEEDVIAPSSLELKPSESGNHDDSMLFDTEMPSSSEMKTDSNRLHHPAVVIAYRCSRQCARQLRCSGSVLGSRNETARIAVL